MAVHVSAWLPLLAIMLLKILVLLRLGYCRFILGAGRDQKECENVYELLDPEKVAVGLSTAEQQAMRSLVNQGEVPPLFIYICLLTSLYPHPPAMLFFVASWLFVVLRFGHAWVHCFSNKQVYRRRLFVSSSIILVALYCELVWKVLAIFW